MCHRGAFRKDIIEKCVFCKTEDIGIEHVTDKPYKLDANTKIKKLLEIIEYYYYSKKLFESKDEKENDNNGIKLIKEFIKNMHYTYGKEFNKKDN